MDLLLDFLTVLIVPVICAFIAKCAKGIVSFAQHFDGTNREQALQIAKDEMKIIGPELCLLAIGGDFGAGHGYVLNIFGLLLLVHFAMFVGTLAMTVLASTERVRIWYNDMVGLAAVFVTSIFIVLRPIAT